MSGPGPAGPPPGWPQPGLLRRCLLLLVLLLLLPSQAFGAPAQTTRPELRDRIARLRARLAARPDDVDTRLRLAHTLSWTGARAAARRHVRRVLARKPRYWDAHVLLARLDAWARRYGEARDRLVKVLKAAPYHRAARLLLADVAIWSGDVKQARQQLEWLLARKQSAAIYYRLAQVARRRRRTLRAYLLAGEALARAPRHAGARRLRRQTPLVRVDTGYELESLPGGQLGHGEFVALTALPGAVVSGTLLHEYRYRYASHNQRLSAALYWRATPWLMLRVFGGAGFPAVVVPRANAGAGGELSLGSWRFDLAYAYDLLTLPGDLHRTSLAAAVVLPHGLEASVGYTLGVLDTDDATELVHAAYLRGGWSWSWLQLGLVYGYGTEMGRSTRWRSLDELRSHDFGLQLWAQVLDRVALGSGYDLLFRSNDTRVYLARVGLRLTL